MRYIIRLNRKNEFNAYWAYLIALEAIFLALAYKATKTSEIMLIAYATTVLLAVAFAYQGLEIVKKK